jgi:hypothetical protein
MANPLAGRPIFLMTEKNAAIGDFQESAPGSETGHSLKFFRNFFYSQKIFRKKARNRIDPDFF